MPGTLEIPFVAIHVPTPGAPRFAPGAPAALMAHNAKIPHQSVSGSGRGKFNTPGKPFGAAVSKYTLSRSQPFRFVRSTGSACDAAMAFDVSAEAKETINSRICFSVVMRHILPGCHRLLCCRSITAMARSCRGLSKAAISAWQSGHPEAAAKVAEAEQRGAARRPVCDRDSGNGHLPVCMLHRRVRNVRQIHDALSNVLQGNKL